MITLYIRQEWIASSNREWVVSDSPTGRGVRGGQTAADALRAAQEVYDISGGAVIHVTPAGKDGDVWR